MPNCYIIAGPNGAGKTTFAMKFLPSLVGDCQFLNADEIAHGLSPLAPDRSLLQASRLFLKLIKEHLAEGRDFAFETTLSGRSYLQRIRDWQSVGWRVEMFYLYIPNTEVSASRVRMRVEQGGHDIPAEDIVRRYPRSLKNLLEYAKVCDRTVCFDNSTFDIKLIFGAACGGEIVVNDTELFAKISKEISNVVE